MTDWARRVMDEVDGALPPQVSCNVAGCRCGTSTTQLHKRLPPYTSGSSTGDLRPRDYRTGFATENVVPVTTAEQDATRKWIEAIHWATGEDVR